MDNKAQAPAASGTTLQWFPMRATYNSQMAVKEHLDALGINTYIPMQYRVIERHGDRHMMLVPAISNLVFVNATKELLVDLKHSDANCQSLRFIMRRPLPYQQAPAQIITVPDRQMQHFMQVASAQDERVIYLDYNHFIGSEGRRVRVTDGFFAGVEGKLKRIKKNKHLVVEIEGVMAVAIVFLPPKSLMLLD